MQNHNSNWLQKWVDRLVRRIIDPFANASSTEQYGNRGFFLLGCVLLLFVGAFWPVDELHRPLSDSPAFAAIVALFGTAVHVAIPIGATLIGLLFVGYVSLLLIPRARQAVGRAVANSAISLLDGALSFGEWCLDHRLRSLGLAVALITAMASMTTLAIDRATEHASMARDAERWVQSAEEFLRESTLSETDYERYGSLPHWREESREALPANRGGEHPAVTLHRMFVNIFEPRSPKGIPDRIYDRRAILDSLARRTIAARQGRDQTERLAANLVTVLRARIWVRDFDRCTTRCLGIDSAKDAFEQLDTAFLSGARQNGTGTIYARAVSLALVGDQSVAARLCESIMRCAELAIMSYEAAGGAGTQCSFAARRRDNNVTDLLNRIGHHYGTFTLASGPSPTDSPFRDPKALAARIADQIQRLMGCTDQGVLIQPVYVTTAQAFATRADLLSPLGVDVSGDVRNAAMYLRLAYSFGRADLSSWKLDYFCIGLRPSLQKTFSDGLTNGLVGLPTPEWGLLRSQIAGRCI